MLKPSFHTMIPQDSYRTLPSNPHNGFTANRKCKDGNEAVALWITTDRNILCFNESEASFILVILVCIHSFESV